MKLLQNGEVITNTSDLLTCWSDHFECLGHSVPDKHVKCSKEKIQQLNTLTPEREDYVFYCEITVEEIEQALKRLKLRKASGQDGTVSEHLKFGGQMLVIWLKQVLNAIVEMEEIPQSFKHSIIIPVFKGKGRDPLKKVNYRGIALTPVIAKLLEFITLAHLQSILEELGVPSRMQTAYRKHTSCDDAIFANLEAMSHYLAQEDQVMMCSFDLEKAFDTVEYGVLLQHLFDAGIDGKCWRLVKSWYTMMTSSVRINGHLSDPFVVERGVRQGSVLSVLLSDGPTPKRDARKWVGVVHQWTSSGLKRTCR